VGVFTDFGSDYGNNALSATGAASGRHIFLCNLAPRGIPIGLDGFISWL